MNRVLYERSRSLLLSQSDFKQIFEKLFLINFICTYSKLLKHFIFAGFLVIEDYENDALRKESIFSLFEERFIAGTLRKPS